MRSLMGFLVLGVVAGLSACTVVPKEDEASGGAGGTAGTGASGGSGGGADACQGVPTTGQCVDESTIRTCLPSEERDGTPVVLQISCTDLEKCVEQNGYAQCSPKGECDEGARECKDVQTLRTCLNGTWMETACVGSECIADNGFGAGCIQQEAGAGVFLKGRFQYQLRTPNDPVKPTQYGALKTEGGGNFIVTVYDDNKLIGLDITSPGNDGKQLGEFDVELSQQPNPGTTFVYFWAVAYGNSGKPMMAVARAESDQVTYQKSTEYWQWGKDACAAPADCSSPNIDMGDVTILEGDGSGAAHVFSWMVYDYFRFKDMSALASTDPLSVLILWQGAQVADSVRMKPETAGIKFDCGNCFAPPSLGGGRVTYDPSDASAVDHFDTTMNISGASSSVSPAEGNYYYESHWSRSTLNHEIGHWAMSSYSVSPGEGGPHSPDGVALPGLAYSEGWATFSGQTNISNSLTDNNPVYFTMQYGTGFWINISNATWAVKTGTPEQIPMPNPNQPVDQDINEIAVANMMWSLWAGANATNNQSLGDQPLFNTIAAPRLLSGKNRGYYKVDFVDYLDAMSCQKYATDTQIAAVADGAGYPWKSSEVVCQ